MADQKLPGVVEVDLNTGIEAFLSAQRAEGRYYDTATFTIDSVKALQKLSAHQLPHSGLWLVKLVQAAVASGAKAIDIKFGRKTVQVAFHPLATWQADDLLETVVSGVLSQDQALNHVVTAIRASSGSATEAVSWSCGEAKVELSAQSCQVIAQPHSSEFRLTASRPSRSRTLSQMLSSSVTQLVKQTVEEHDALRERCWVCPIPITVDGQKLPTGYDLLEGGHVAHNPWHVLRKWEKSEQVRLGVCLGIRPLTNAGPEIPYLVTSYPIDHSDQQIEVTRPVYKGETFLRWSFDQTVCRGAVAVLAGRHDAEPKVDFVLDGAVVASHQLPRWSLAPPGFTLTVKPFIGVRAVLGVNPDDLDLSQFAIREPNLDGVMDRVAPELEALVEKVRENLFRFYYLPFTRRAAPVVGCGIGAQLVFLTAVTQGALLIPAAGMLAAATAINTASWRKQVNKALGQLALQVAGELPT